MDRQTADAIIADVIAACTPDIVALQEVDFRFGARPEALPRGLVGISVRDAESFDLVHRRLLALARYLQPFFLEEPPNLYARGWAKVREGSRA